MSEHDPYLGWAKRGDHMGTHWDGCEEAHHDCAVALLVAARAERDEWRQAAGAEASRRRELTADCAAMREALVTAAPFVPDGTMCAAQVDAALTGTAGADLMRVVEAAKEWADLRRSHPRCCVEGCDNLVCEKHRQDAALIAAVDALGGKP